MTDNFSWGDSSFDDDSWMSEPESVCNNWRGWKKLSHNNNVGPSTSGPNGGAGADNNNKIIIPNYPDPMNPINPPTRYSRRVPRLPTNMDLQQQSQRHQPIDQQSDVSSSLEFVFTENMTQSEIMELTGAVKEYNNNLVDGQKRKVLLNRYDQKSFADVIITSFVGGDSVPSLTELASRAVAANISFEVVERVCSPVPEQLQLRIAYWSFPDNEEDIRLYSCLANGSADEYQKGETLYRCNAVEYILQIGFHLSATVISPPIKACAVAVTFDRCRITSCNCTCSSASSWCSHVVAVCLKRIYQPTALRLRAPVSESLTRLSRDQLQKFAQYMISESPQQILPTAQRLLDDLLMNEKSNINRVRGAPDPTAGAPASEQTKWCLDEIKLHQNIRKIVIKLCIPAPMVYSDVNYLSSAAPPAAAEWCSLLRPLRGREPEGLWNLLSIVREMLRRHDGNAIPLLRILTEELLSCDQIIIWWFFTNVSLHRGCPPNSSHSSNNSNSGSNNRSMHSNIYASQHACCSLCDEIVLLWRLVTLNPAHSDSDTQTLYDQLKEYHLKTLQLIYRFHPNSAINQNYHKPPITINGLNNHSSIQAKMTDLEIFSGFKPAMISCLVDWDSYPISGVTHQKKKYRQYEPSLHDQLNSVSHAITGTMLSLRLDPRAGLGMAWASKSNHLMYQSDQYSDTNSSGEKDGKKSRSGSETRNEEDSPSSHDQHNQRKDNESIDSGNQEFWERFSVASSDEDNNLNNNQANGDEINPSNQSENEAPKDHHPNDNDYQIYVYNNDLENIKDVKNSNDQPSSSRSGLKWDPILLKATTVQPIEDPSEILLARAEALYAHGYVEEACLLSVRLAEELLKNPPDLRLDISNTNNNSNGQMVNQIDPAGQSTISQQASTSSSISTNNSRSAHTKRMNRNRFNPALHQLSLLTSATLSKAAFLCLVLSENENCHLLAFHIGLFGLELVRPPASTKALEVKLAHQEQELVNLLKPIPLCPQALDVLREKAKQLKDGRLTARGEALLPISLASYIFEAIVLSPKINLNYQLFLTSSDEKLAFDAAVAAIGLKAKVSEAEHPLLCEGTRRQRGDLALQLIVHYKDNKQRLDLIMEKLLDQEIHPIFNANKKSSIHNSNAIINNNMTNGKTAAELLPKSSKLQAQTSLEPEKTIDGIAVITATVPVANNSQESDSASEKSPPTITQSITTSDKADPLNTEIWNLVQSFNNLEPSSSENVITNVDKNKSIDSSAPDTTSSDNSPTVQRRNIFHKTGPTNSVSESSGSSGESSSSSSNDSSITRTIKKIQNKEMESGAVSDSHAAEADQSGPSESSKQTVWPGLICSISPVAAVTTSPQQRRYPSWAYSVSTPHPSCSSVYQPNNNVNNSSVGGGGGGGGGSSFKLRYKGKRHYPVIPNQPSDASAHFMFDLAKNVLSKAGGNNTTVVFNPNASPQTSRSPHRLLHMCAFQIGLYALGLHNAVSPNWLSRTYSSHVSWITCQAKEIGHQAIRFLIDTWEGHLTPSEVASLADRASRSQESVMVKAAAELALSCLTHAHALTINEIQRALIQCKEQNTNMLELACLAIEQAAQGGGVYPEVLFDVARNWYQLYLAEKMNEIEERRQQNNNENSIYSDQPTNGSAKVTSEALANINSVQPDYYDPAMNQQQHMQQQPPSFGPMDPNAAYPPQIDPNYYQPLLQAPTSNPYQADMNQFMFIQTNRNYPQRPLNSKNNVNNQQPKSMTQHYPRPPAVIFDPIRGYYSPSYGASFFPPPFNSFNPLMNGSIPALKRNLQNLHHSMAPNMSNQQVNQVSNGSNLYPCASSGSFYYPMVNSSQPPNMAPVMSANSAQPGTNPCSFMAPLSLFRTQLGYVPCTLSPQGQGFRFFPMEQLAQPFHLAASNCQQNVAAGGNASNNNSSLQQLQIQQQQLPNTAQTILGPRQLSFMHAAYRVGMLAMDTLARRAPDDRPQTRYARNPTYGEDVKWLLFISKKLGTQYVQEFCLCSLTAISSPFVLYDIIMEAAQSIFQSASNNTAYMQTVRSQILTPLIQKCQQMFASCLYFQIMHISSSDYDEFITTLRMARTAYQMMPGGNIPFNDLLQSLKRTKTCKKELWQLITNAMQN